MRKIICPININAKAKAKKYFRGIDFTLIFVSMVASRLACYRMGNRPRTKNGRKMAGEMAGSHFWGGVQKWPKNGRAHGRICRNHQILVVQPFARHFSAILDPPQKMAAGHFPGHFSAIFGFVPVSHSVAGQPSRKSMVIFGPYLENASLLK